MNLNITTNMTDNIRRTNHQGGALRRFIFKSVFNHLAALLTVIFLLMGSLGVAVTQEDVCHTCLLFGRDGIAAFAVAIPNHFIYIFQKSNALRYI